MNSTIEKAAGASITNGLHTDTNTPNSASHRSVNQAKMHGHFRKGISGQTGKRWTAGGAA